LVIKYILFLINFGQGLPFPRRENLISILTLQGMLDKRTVPPDKPHPEGNFGQIPHPEGNFGLILTPKGVLDTKIPHPEGNFGKMSSPLLEFWTM
jgi:hypothetical protein